MGKYRIVIQDELKKISDMPDLLKEIIRQIEQGNTSGRGGPVWDIEVVGAKTGQGEGSKVENEDESGLGNNGEPRKPQDAEEASDEVES